MADIIRLDEVDAANAPLVRIVAKAAEPLIRGDHFFRELVDALPAAIYTTDAAGFVGRLAARGVRVCLGHSNATYLETSVAMAEGLTGFTHLFNAMRPLASREPGPVGAALESPESWFGMIVDGVHVDPVMLRLALRGRGRPMLVTDAMPPVGGNEPDFRLYGETIRTDAGRYLRQDGSLAGANLDMATAVRNCVRLLGVPLESALRFASAHPARFLRVDHWLGHLAPGYRADLVAFDPETIEVVAVWSAGSAFDATTGAHHHFRGRC